jgi:DNA-binding response OmpR family regulator
MGRLLVVDDEENIRLLYQKELAAEGHQVFSAATVAEAQQLFDSQKPELVVLDLKLTAEDGGLETLRWMREADKSIPIVINTAYPAYKADFSSWLADAYVVKSGNLKELKETIKGLLDKF